MTSNWWRCTNCGEINPPGIKYCTTARCRRPRPDLEKPKPEPETKEQETKPVPAKETKPDEPKKKIPWKLIAAVLGAVAFALKFAPIPGFVVVIIDYLVKILQAIPG